MIMWLIGGMLLAVVAVVGYYQGAVRAAFSLVGLLAATLLALPIGGIIELVLPVFGLKHPVLVNMVGPFIAFLIVLIAFKIGGFMVNRKLDTFYKYQDSDTRRLLFERMNQRVGICIGLANGAIYFFLICIVVHLIGYATFQFRGSASDPFAMKVVNFLAAAISPSGMDKAIAPFDPAPQKYYDGVDILGDIYHTPLLQSRLSTYPPFLRLAERPEFKAIGNDSAFLEFWQRQPVAIREFTTHQRINALIKNVDLFNEVLKLVGDDLIDLRTYLHTGESPKYADEKILGRWRFSVNRSMDKALARKPNMNFAERKRLKGYLIFSMRDAVLTASLDEKITIKGPQDPIEGRWKRVQVGKYEFKLPEGETEATLDANTLTFFQRNTPFVFRKM